MDDRLAERFCRAWLGPAAVLTRIDAMNSSTWLVRAGDDRYALKIARPAESAGLEAATALEAAGLRTGAPVRWEVRDGRLVALLRFVDGELLTEHDAAVIGETLGRAHRLLASVAVPAELDRWPWPWLRPEVIEEGALRDAATAAIRRAEALADGVTHGILHGDPAPEAFIRGGEDVGLIDWGSACHGPLLFDVASAWMYTRRSDALLDAYARSGPLGGEELRLVPEFLAFRWALQAWYFSVRLAGHDLTGVDSQADNEAGLADARAFLLG